MYCSDCAQALPAENQACPKCGSTRHLPGIVGDPLARPGLITLLAVLHIIGGTLMAAAALASFASDETVGLFVGAPLAAIAALHFATAVGLLKLRPYGRTLEIVLAIIGLIGFPVGTIVSILILYYMFRPGIRVLFSGKSAEQLTTEELHALAQIQGTSVLGVVLLSVALLFVCGIIAAISVPNLLNAIDRGKQKRTMADIRSISDGLELYYENHEAYPVAGGIEELEGVISRVPPADGWGNLLEVQSGPDGYEIRSTGKDGLADRGSPQGPTSELDADIIMIDGEFVQWPEALQR